MPHEIGIHRHTMVIRFSKVKKEHNIIKVKSGGSCGSVWV